MAFLVSLSLKRGSEKREHEREREKRGGRKKEWGLRKILGGMGVAHTRTSWTLMGKLG